MNELNEYKIPFKGLKDGVHDYVFHVTKTFFEKLGFAEVYDSEIDVKLKLDKSSTLLDLHLELKGNILLTCDLCLDEFDYDFESNNRIIVKFGEETEDIDDNLIFISPAEHHLDISVIIYEEIVLNLPVRRVHPDDENGNTTCNPEQLELLNKFKNQKGIEHRFDALKDLKLDN